MCTVFGYAWVYHRINKGHGHHGHVPLFFCRTGSAEDRRLIPARKTLQSIFWAELCQERMNSKMSLSLVFNSLLLGVGLAMDAFSVSIANGLAEPHMSHSKMNGIAGCYAFFQWLMPMIGWFCVHTIAAYFTAFQKFIPWIALGLLLFIGIQMIVEGIQDRRKANEKDCSAAVPGTAESSADAACEEKADNNTVSDRRLTLSQLILQGIATSIDALSVGFTIAEYRALEAFGSSVIIAVVTFFICMGGLLFGRKFGEKLAGRATILGGLILIGIGAEIFIRGVF